MNQPKKNVKGYVFRMHLKLFKTKFIGKLNINKQNFRTRIKKPYPIYSF